MDKIDIVLTTIGLGFAFTFALLRTIWTKIEKVDDKVNDIDKRLYRLEGVISTKDCLY